MSQSIDLIANSLPAGDYFPDTGACNAFDTVAARPPVSAAANPLGARTITDVLEELDTGIVVCDEEGRIELANDPARRELRDGQSLALGPDGGLCVALDATPTSPAWKAALRAAVHSRRRQLLAIRSDRRSLMVSVMPLGQDGERVLVMLGRRQPAPDLAVEMLGQLCDLTDAEQKILCRLLAGQRIELIASTRGVKLSTLRTQVSSIRDKLGARRLEDLVRMAAELPPMTTVLRSPALQFDGASAKLSANTLGAGRAEDALWPRAQSLQPA